MDFGCCLFILMRTACLVFLHVCMILLESIPVALLISQCQKEVDDHPGLLRFSEVVNLFHEFGHVVYSLSSYSCWRWNQKSYFDFLLI
ncbi:hypothetical protein CK203_077090 [Vitis vinifera]|uniref:Peptidase M3A/M3B catalytic domain-containing protein n=1 Tax=Vitis vinifera TaxID=29760 RepID=A0A438DJ02_VITVI|nr:hypothetical protein CK203_077090 [Vitis vinifera]